MGTRLQKTLQDMRDAGRKGLLIYLTAGAPDVDATLEAVKRAQRAGADVIELGLPFSDPMADGPVIQAASVRALREGMTTRRILELLQEIRSFTDVPIVGMGYFNTMLHYGLKKFVTDFQKAGLDGLIIPDLPHEEASEMQAVCQAQELQELYLMEFITPSTTEARLQKICHEATGFVYCVSNNGVTGVKEVDYTPIHQTIRKARAYTDIPMAVGFGIGTPRAAVQAAKGADAVIVGSAVMKLLLAEKLDEAEALIASLRAALDAHYPAQA